MPPDGRWLAPAPPGTDGRPREVPIDGGIDGDGGTRVDRATGTGSPGLAGRRPGTGGRARRQPAGDDQAAAGPVLDAQPAAVGLDDLLAQREADARARLLGRRVERQQGALHHGRVHARPAVDHPQHALALRRQVDGHPDLAGRAARLLRVLQEVDQHLLHLHGVEPAGLRGRNRRQLERAHRVHALQELPPVDGLRPRLGQPREPRVALEEGRQVRGPLLDRREDPLEQRGVLRPPGRLARGVRERADGRERVVELVAHHADGALPDLDLLAPQLGRQALDEVEHVRLHVEVEHAARGPVGLLLALAAHGEERVARRVERLAQLAPAAGEHLGDHAALQACPRAQQVAGRAVAVDDAAVAVLQDDADGRALQDGVEQQLALVDVVPLGAQGVAHLVVERDQLAQLVVARGREAHAEVGVAEAADAVRERRQGPARGGQRPADREQRQDVPADTPATNTNSGCGTKNAAPPRDGRGGGHVHAHQQRHLAGDAEARPRGRTARSRGRGRGRFGRHRGSVCAAQERGRRSRLMPSFSIRR